jgi:hypothetical protein
VGSEMCIRDSQILVSALSPKWRDCFAEFSNKCDEYRDFCKDKMSRFYGLLLQK